MPVAQGAAKKKKRRLIARITQIPPAARPSSLLPSRHPPPAKPRLAPTVHQSAPRTAPPCRKLELQAQARAALEAENSWWKDAAGAPPNLVSACTKAEYKAAIVNAAPNQLVVSACWRGAPPS